MDDREIEEIFRLIDRNGDGLLSKHEMKKFFKNHGVKYRGKEIKAFMQRTGSPKGRKINVSDLKSALRTRVGNAGVGGIQTHY
ncbi:unnamed protein product [Calicophoron daubneyi]|uniref:EF-hand domain-containing protein n=1 Tax=Calicophoron daubneyi TaxID=300641 RepID=A0AAV2TT16_CALDB